MQVYHNLPTNEYGCQANATDLHPYISDTIINIGEKYDNACMVKYYLTNNNKDMSLRIQIYKDGDAATYLKALAAAASIVTLFSSLIWRA